MISILFDFVGAYLIIRFTSRIYAQVALALMVGISSSFLATGISYWISEYMTPGEAFLRVMTGMLLHPLITLAFLWWLRHPAKGVPLSQGDNITATESGQTESGPAIWIWFLMPPALLIALIIVIPEIVKMLR